MTAEIKPEIKPESKGRGGKRPGAGRKPKARTGEGPATQSDGGPPVLPLLTKRSELVPVTAAASAGWAIPADRQQQAVESCVAILDDAGASGRLKLTAVRCLSAIERLNRTTREAIVSGTLTIRVEYADCHADVPEAAPGTAADPPGDAPL